MESDLLYGLVELILSGVLLLPCLALPFLDGGYMVLCTYDLRLRVELTLIQGQLRLELICICISLAGWLLLIPLHYYYVLSI